MRRAEIGRTRPTAASSVLLVLASLVLAGPLDAQTGRIEGTIKETARPRGVKGASVMIARLDPDPPVAFGAKPDERVICTPYASTWAARTSRSSAGLWPRSDGILRNSGRLHRRPWPCTSRSRPDTSPRTA